MTLLRPYLLLLLLWAGYFHPLILHPTQTLYAPYSDLLAEHLPAKVFLNHEWRSTGELPLWNPYHFCGSPFVHDIQVGMFYPPHAVVFLVPESAVGAAISWEIALHVLVAGVFAFIYGRMHQLNEVGSLVTAVGFMLSSKWMTHLLLAGHSIGIGFAWLPLVLLAAERGIANRSVWWVLAAGVALTLFGLGTQPQPGALHGHVRDGVDIPGGAVEVGSLAAVLVRWCGGRGTPGFGATVPDVGSGAVVGAERRRGSGRHSFHRVQHVLAARWPVAKLLAAGVVGNAGRVRAILAGRGGGSSASCRGPRGGNSA